MNNDSFNIHSNRALLIGSVQTVLAQVHSVGSTATEPHASGLIDSLVDTLLYWVYCYYKTWFIVKIKEIFLPNTMSCSKNPLVSNQDSSTGMVVAGAALVLERDLQNEKIYQMITLLANQVGPHKM